MANRTNSNPKYRIQSANKKKILKKKKHSQRNYKTMIMKNYKENKLKGVLVAGDFSTHALFLFCSLFSRSKIERNRNGRLFPFKFTHPPSSIISKPSQHFAINFFRNYLRLTNCNFKTFTAHCFYQNA